MSFSTNVKKLDLSLSVKNLDFKNDVSIDNDDVKARTRKVLIKEESY